MTDMHVALIRGINVGGKNKLPMKDLVKIFEKTGCRDVKTYIQSGNIVFQAEKSTVKKVAGAVAAGIEKQFGYTVPVVIRSGGETGEPCKSWSRCASKIRIPSYG